MLFGTKESAKYITALGTNKQNNKPRDQEPKWTNHVKSQASTKQPREQWRRSEPFACASVYTGSMPTLGTVPSETTSSLEGVFTPPFLLFVVLIFYQVPRSTRLVQQVSWGEMVDVPESKGGLTFIKWENEKDTLFERLGCPRRERCSFV